MLSRQTILLEEDEESPEDQINQTTASSIPQDSDEQRQEVNAEPPVLDFSEEDLYFAGFSGRTNKIADTCYCFWNTGALAVGPRFIDNEELTADAGPDVEPGTTCGCKSPSPLSLRKDSAYCGWFREGCGCPSG